MKPWSQVTERERGWIEGVFAAGRSQGQQGRVRSLSISRSLPDTPYKLRELLGGQVRYRMKKHAYQVHMNDGDFKDTVYTYNDQYCYEWIAKSDDFLPAMERLSELELPFNLRATVDVHLNDVAA